MNIYSEEQIEKWYKERTVTVAKNYGHYFSNEEDEQAYAGGAWEMAKLTLPKVENADMKTNDDRERVKKSMKKILYPEEEKFIAENQDRCKKCNHLEILHYLAPGPMEETHCYIEGCECEDY